MNTPLFNPDLICEAIGNNDEQFKEGVKFGMAYAGGLLTMASCDMYADITKHIDDTTRKAILKMVRGIPEQPKNPHMHVV